MNEVLVKTVLVWYAQAKRGVVWFLLGLIKLYRLILSPYIGQQCRFYPTCSHYGEEAILKHGALYGSWLTLKRIVRCQPFCEGGFDPVPAPKNQSALSPNAAQPMNQTPSFNPKGNFDESE